MLLQKHFVILHLLVEFAKELNELNELKKLNELSLSIVAEELRLYPIRPERAEAPSPGLGAFGPSART